MTTHYVPRCACTHRDIDTGRSVKHFRDLPGPTSRPCPAHGRASA